MIVFLSLPRFYVRPQEEPAPLVVVRDKAVLDMDDAAERAGVRVGMPVRQARALLLDSRLLPWKEEDYHDAQIRWLDVCAQFTGIIEPHDQHAAWLDFSSHPRAIELLAKLRDEIEKTTGLRPRIGVAKTKWLSKVAAELGDDDYFALNYPQAFLSELPVALLTPLAPEHRQRLQFLGYRFAREVADVPLATLRAQFGEDAHTIQQASRGDGSRLVQAVYPPDALHELFHFPGATDSILNLDEGMSALANRIGQRLSDKERQGSLLRIQIELESGKMIARERTFTKPVRCPRSALAAMRLLLAEPPLEPVLSIRVVLRELKRTVRSQLDLMGSAPVAEKDARIASAFSYVRKVFGEESVVQASQVQIPRRVRVLKEWKHATGWR